MASSLSGSHRLTAFVIAGLVACGGAVAGKSSGGSEGGAAGTAPGGGLASTQGGSHDAASGGASSAYGGAGGCQPTPVLPDQDPSCPTQVMFADLWSVRCEREGLTCQILRPTGGSNPCAQPPIIWSVTCCDGGWKSLNGICPALNDCYDVGWGLSAEGTLLLKRGDEDVPVFTAKAEWATPISGDPICNVLDNWRCHLGSAVIGAEEATATLTGEGGDISPGAYALVSLTAFGGMDPGALIGTQFKQTLNFSPTSVVFQSDDNRRVNYTGSYRYTVDGSALSLTPTCESQPEQYRPWSLDMTFTASAEKLELFSSTLSSHATYELIR